ncbi:MULTISPECIES: hypothetical protein [unclassified Leeuwenhoekiella]|uniref:hypothetical protein n=1 Tax=unclassified Leeuwenhoekiella TaxID=2615029 RepID=UPI000C6A9770|nr:MULTISPECIES: hypothetical protein [unclassified Leeuwenhoekiella]MAW95803.1 hypothetical protein [Leeuwenhoekiella sp.]MBA82926.1 hypothetical protein [Leeuwenhoekiella sp.]|tara:strand:- start:20421 stop:21581 length:1161 start_codon:yes stop_codon:yes gene_type:complete
MKKLLYLFTVAILGYSATGCDPVEDINDELAANEEGIVDEFDYTLTEDDYTEILELSFPNFNSIDDAKELIPQVLTANFPYLGANSLAFVSYDLYQPVQTERSLIVYTVTTEDYDAYPDTAEYNNFDDEDQIYTFLDDKFGDVANRTLVSLTYKFYNGSAQTLNNGFLRVNGSWQFALGLTNSEYNAVGQGFANFNTEDEALRKLPIFLKDKFKYDDIQEGDVKSVMYKLYTTDVDDLDEDGRVDDNATYSFIANFIFQGSEWVEYNNVVSQTLQFGNDGTNWIPDNTISYSLTAADYNLIGTSLESKYPAQTASMLRYGNLDRRNGNDAFWSDDMILEALNLLLDNLDPNAEEGQKYAVTFDIYNGSNTTETDFVIKTDGIWVRQ